MTYLLQASLIVPSQPPQTSTFHQLFPCASTQHDMTRRDTTNKAPTVPPSQPPHTNMRLASGHTSASRPAKAHLEAAMQNGSNEKTTYLQPSRSIPLHIPSADPSRSQPSPIQPNPVLPPPSSFPFPSSRSRRQRKARTRSDGTRTSDGPGRRACNDVFSWGLGKKREMVG